MSKAITRLLRHDQSVPRGSDGAILYSDSIEECRKQKFDDASQWPLEDWISTLAKGGGAKKRFQYCVNPNSSDQFLYLRAIQGHSGDNAVDPELQTNVLLPKGFTEYMYHVGNASELSSKIRNGLIPVGKSLKKRKTSCVLHFRESDGGWKWYGGNSMRSDETKDRAIQEYLETLSKYGILVHFEARLRERLAILPNTVTRSRSLQHTICRVHGESGMYEDTRGALQKNSINSKSATGCTRIELATWSTRSTKPRRKIILRTIEHGEICTNTVDHIIFGVLSAVE